MISDEQIDPRGSHESSNCLPQMYGGILTGHSTAFVVGWGFKILPGAPLLSVTLPQPRQLGHSMCWLQGKDDTAECKEQKSPFLAFMLQKPETGKDQDFFFFLALDRQKKKKNINLEDGETKSKRV